ncbi:MAG: nucleoside triphosphate pyrophosphohydrolase [Planctomycetota bacterium]
MNDRSLDASAGAFAELVAVIARLRGDGGCPWDRAQTPRSMAPHLLEECFEAIDAIESGRPEAVREELGDVLMNVLLVAQMHAEWGDFDAAAMAQAVAEKLVRRHPHVFGSTPVDSAEAALAGWEAVKRAERGDAKADTSVLAGLPRNLPALLWAYRAGQKAARIGFDWPDRHGPRAKIDEELAELDAAIEAAEPAAIRDEFGDVLFSLCNLARHLDLDPETALRAAGARFEARFRRVERELGPGLAAAGLEALDAAWERAKAEIRREADDPPTQ